MTGFVVNRLSLRNARIRRRSANLLEGQANANQLAMTRSLAPYVSKAWDAKQPALVTVKVLVLRVRLLIALYKIPNAKSGAAQMRRGERARLFRELIRLMRYV